MPRRTPTRSADASTSSAAEFIPKGIRLTLPLLRDAVQGCRGCDLYKRATQAVFGRGPARAAVMLVGEQPGDQEDQRGEPFVGPAGRVLDEALAEAGIDRTQVYVTNTVKHFKWEGAGRGKRRIHSKPNAREIKACLPWLEAELELVEPRVVVALGATAAQALLGSAFRLTQHRGEFFADSRWAPQVTATIHPSAILRAPDHEARLQMRREFVADLKRIAALIAHPIRRGPMPGRTAKGGGRAPAGPAAPTPRAGTRRRSASRG